MDRLTSSDWWWDVAFDGIGSSVLTAALAFLGIWLTLRHDRRLARRSDILNECRATSARTRDLLLTATQRPRERLKGWADEIDQLAVFVRQDDPRLSDLLTAICDSARWSSLSGPKASEIIQTAWYNADLVLRSYVKDPTVLGAMPDETWNVMMLTASEARQVSMRVLRMR